MFFQIVILPVRNRCFKMIREDIAKLGTVKLRQDSGPWFSLIDSDSFISDTSDEQIKKAIIAGDTYFEIRLTEELMAHLREHRSIVPFPIELFLWVGQNENAYAIAKRLILHHNINSRRTNRPKGKWKLRVSTLLKCCPIKADQHKGNVRRTFEKSINFLASFTDGYGPLITWRYIVDGKGPPNFSNKK